MVATQLWGLVPSIDAVLRGTRQRGRGGCVADPSSLS